MPNHPRVRWRQRQRNEQRRGPGMPLTCLLLAAHRRSGPVLAFASLQDAASLPNAASTPPLALPSEQQRSQALPPSVLHTLKESLLSPPVLAGLAAISIGSCPPLEVRMRTRSTALHVWSSLLTVDSGALCAST